MVVTAHELRIGNWLARGGNGEPFQATSETMSDFFWLKMKPTGIPLTEDWLVKKFGFKENDYAHDADVYFVYGEFRLFRTDAGFLYQADCGSIIIKTVHHCQNLYLDLTGEQLNVVEKRK